MLQWPHVAHQGPYELNTSSPAAYSRWAARLAVCLWPRRHDSSPAFVARCLTHTPAQSTTVMASRHQHFGSIDCATCVLLTHRGLVLKGHIRHPHQLTSIAAMIQHVDPWHQQGVGGAPLVLPVACVSIICGQEADKVAGVVGTLGKRCPTVAALAL